MRKVIGRLVEYEHELVAPKHWVEVEWEDGQKTQESLWRCYKRWEELVKKRDRENAKTRNKPNEVILHRADRLHPDRFLRREDWLAEIVRDIRMFPPGEHGSMKGEEEMPDTAHGWRCAEAHARGWLSLFTHRFIAMTSQHEGEGRVFRENMNRLGFNSNSRLEQQAAEGKVDLVKILFEKGA